MRVVRLFPIAVAGVLAAVAAPALGATTPPPHAAGMSAQADIPQPPAGRPRVLRMLIAPSTVGFASPTGRRSDITFGVQIDRAVVARLQVTRTVPGRRRGTACVAPTRALVRAKARGCVRQVLMGTLGRRLGAMEEYVFNIERSRIGTRTLAPGRYRARLTATAGGRSAAPRTIAFRILGPQD